MAGRDEELQKVMAAAQRYAKYGDRSELETFALPILRKADYQLSNRDEGSGYRRAIADRIRELESKQANVLDIKPGAYGVNLNVSELWRRLSQWWKTRSK
jgi:hypothetical protein